MLKEYLPKIIFLTRLNIVVFNEHTGYLKHFHYDNWRDDIANNLWQLIGKGCTKN